MNAPEGSEGTWDALLPASPVPERQTTESANRKSKRPAINCTGSLAIFVPSGNSLLPELRRLLVRMGAEDHWKPSHSLIRLCSLGDWKGRHLTVNMVNQNCAGVHVNLAFLEKRGNGGDSFLGDGRPKNNIVIRRPKKSKLSAKSLNLPGEFSK